MPGCGKRHDDHDLRLAGQQQARSARPSDARREPPRTCSIAGGHHPKVPAGGNAAERATLDLVQLQCRTPAALTAQRRHGGPGSMSGATPPSRRTWPQPDTSADIRASRAGNPGAGGTGGDAPGPTALTPGPSTLRAQGAARFPEVGLRGERGSRIEDPVRNSSKAERLQSNPQ